MRSHQSFLPPSLPSLLLHQRAIDMMHQRLKQTKGISIRAVEMESNTPRLPARKAVIVVFLW